MFYSDDEIKSILKRAHEDIDKASQFRLRIKESSCFLVVNGKMRYLSVKDREEARAIAQRDYALKVERILKGKQRISKEVREDPVFKVFERLPGFRKVLVRPYVPSLEERIKIWKGMVFERNPFAFPNVVYTSPAGVRVRSKSEMIIAQRLEHFKVPFRYECALSLKRDKKCYPDFTILHARTMEEIIWEHFGMMDNGDYLEEALKKIADYQNAGYVCGKNFIMTFEAANCPLSVKVIDEIIGAQCR